MQKYTWLICAVLFLSACNSGPLDMPTSDSAQSSSSVASSLPGVTPKDSDNAHGSVASAALPDFTGSHVRLIGRFDNSQTGQARFSWSGSALEFLFKGTRASIAIASNGQSRFQVEVDGVVTDLWVNDGAAEYVLASGLPFGVHRVRITRLTESFSVVTSFISDPKVDGKLLAAPAAPQKRLLVLGDSITAGYGVEGSNQTCSYSATSSNQQLAYAALAADALGADLHSIAWSGIGAWRSYGEKTPVNPNILTRYQRTLADDANSQWNVSRYLPAAILVAIGTNDYWEGSAGDEYQLSMIGLVDHIQRDYPGKPVYLLVSPMLNGAARDAQKAVLTSLTGDNVKVLDLGKIETADGFGCDYHPNRVTQTRIAKALEQQLKADLGW